MMQRRGAALIRIWMTTVLPAATTWWAYKILGSAPRLVSNQFANPRDEHLVELLPVAGLAFVLTWLACARPGRRCWVFAPYLATGLTYVATSYVYRHYSRPDDTVLRSRFWDGALFWAFGLSALLLPIVVLLGELLWRVSAASTPKRKQTGIPPRA